MNIFVQNFSQELRDFFARAREMRRNGVLKRIDRYIGIPALLVLGPILRLARGHREAGVPARIGIIKENAIGDTVVLAAALTDLRTAYPNSTIILFTGLSNHAFAKLLAVPDEVVLLPLNQPLKCVKILRDHRLDLLFDAGQWPRINALLSLFSAAACTVGFKTSGQCRHLGYDHVIEHRSDLHEVINFRRLVSWDRPPSSRPSFLFRHCDYPRLTQQTYVVLHQWPGGERSELKEWPLENWVMVARHLLSLGHALVLTGGPSDYLRNGDLLTAFPGAPVFNVAGLPLSQLPSLLKQAKLVVSVNTGLMHLAAVTGTPTVGLHGPTSIARWGPWGPHGFAVASQSRRSQYLNLGFEYPRSCEAMQAVAPGDVLRAIEQALNVPTAALCITIK